MNSFLFVKNGELADHLAEMEPQADRLVDQMSEDELLTQSTEAHVQSLQARLMPLAPSLSMEHVTLKREASSEGPVIIFSIPFDGSADLFHYIPKRRTALPPRGEVSRTLLVSVPMGVRDADAIEAAFSRTIEDIEQYLEAVRQDLAESEACLHQRLTSRITRRRVREANERIVVEELLRRHKGRG